VAHSRTNGSIPVSDKPTISQGAATELAVQLPFAEPLALRHDPEPILACAIFKEPDSSEALACGGRPEWTTAAENSVIRERPVLGARTNSSVKVHGEDSDTQTPGGTRPIKAAKRWDAWWRR